MNPNDTFVRDLEAWLAAEAPVSGPHDLHATVIDRARTMRQRPGWTTSFPDRWFGRGLGRGRGLTLLAAATLLLVGWCGRGRLGAGAAAVAGAAGAGATGGRRLDAIAGEPSETVISLRRRRPRSPGRAP